MNIKEQIRAEIERRHTYEKKQYEKKKPDGRPNDGWAESLAIMGVLEDLLSFLDSLPEQPVEGLEEEVKRYYADNFDYISSEQPTLSILTNIARHFAEWGAEHLRESTKMIPEGLEEAAHNFALHYDNGTCDGIAQDCFIAGAEWQKKQDDLETADLLAIAHLQGMEQQKAKMMEDSAKI